MDVMVKVLLLQALLVVPVFFLLWIVLQKELLSVALEKFAELRLAPGQDQVDQVNIVTASRLSLRQKESWTQAVRQRFGSVPVNFLENRELGGGVILQAGAVVLDHSLALWFRRLQGREEA
jgi:F0F1-type ATP synthase delta subunit